MKCPFRFARVFAVVSAAAVMMAAPAYAAAGGSATGGEVVDSKKAAIAKPMSAWLVGPSQASAFDAKDHPDQNGCLMVTEFDNGMIVGMHARAVGIVGMTVDTKQQTMAVGDRKQIGINIGQDAYVVEAAATDSSTLAFALDAAGGGRKVAERLTALGNFRLLLDGRPQYFATTGFTDGLARLQACMGSAMAVPVVVTGPGVIADKVKHDPMIETMKVTSSGTRTPLALAMPELVPAGYKFTLDDVDPMTPINWQSGDDWVEVMKAALAPHDLKMTVRDRMVRITQRTGDDPVVETSQQNDDETEAQFQQAMSDIPDGVWSAAKGESLASVIEAWGLMAGVNTKVDLMGDLTLPMDVKYEGSFESAVQSLMGQFNGKDKPKAAFKGINASPVLLTEDKGANVDYVAVPSGHKWQPRPPAGGGAKGKSQAVAASDNSKLSQMRPIPDPADAPKKANTEKTAAQKSAKVKTSGTWEALEGTSLRDVLEHWGQDAGIQVVWLTQDTYPLPQSVKTKGKFEEAVAGVLSQYGDRQLQPAAQLNRDPETGEAALIIKSNRL